jgi:hypothetical protein
MPIERRWLLMKMKNKLLLIVAILFLSLFVINAKAYASTDLDEILNYEITVDPRMNDGSLDITYNISWKVLDSTTEGPLTWVQIGTPSSNFSDPTAITSNITNIEKYNSQYVKITFDKSYYTGEVINFKYSITQNYLYKVSGSNCKYTFTPAWFTDIKVDSLTIKWNSDQVKSSDNDSEEGNYLVWKKTNLSKGEKVTATITYDKSSFTSLTNYSSFGSVFGNVFLKYFVIIIMIYIVFAGILSMFGGGYYRHGGFGRYGRRGYFGGCVHHSSCVHSSCAHSSCAHSSCAHSCACACAGSGRAGCSKKDFYGTKLHIKNISEVLKK